MLAFSSTRPRACAPANGARSAPRARCRSISAPTTALTFDTEPLAARVEILGAPVVELDLAVDEPGALLAARLNDVQPDGTSTLVTYGLLNLTHRESHDQPEALDPGTFQQVRLQLTRHRPCLPCRPPHSDRAVHQLLADRQPSPAAGS